MIQSGQWARRLCRSAGAGLLFLACTFPALATGTLVVSNVTVIDPSATDAEMARQAGRAIVIRNGMVVAVQSAEDALPNNAHVVDGRGKFAVPAFWDMHAHVPGDLRIARASFDMQFANGVLYMRDMGTDMALPDLKQLQAGTHSPRVRIVATPYKATDGRSRHRDRASSDEGIFEVESADDVLSMVRFVRRHEIDFVKPYDALSDTAYRALVSQANKAGLSISGHIPRQISVAEAIESGQTSIEHAQSLTWACAPKPDDKRRAYYLGDPDRRFERNLAYPDFAGFVSDVVDLYQPETCATLIRAMADHHVHYVPTLVTRRFDVLASFREYREDPLLAYIDPETRRGWAKDAANYAALAPELRVALHRFLQHAMTITGGAYRAGVPILVGSDSPDSYIFPGFSYHLEMEMLVEAGLPPLAVLHAATIGAARFMEADEQYGTIAPGKAADLVLLDADPLANIVNVRHVHAVVAAGEYTDRAGLDLLLSDVRAEVSKMTTDQDAQ